MDHRLWQAKSDRMTPEQGFAQVKRAFDELQRITGEVPTCSASPGWRCTEQLILCKEALPFRYNSDCRGHSIFLPEVGGRVLTRPQIPLNLPTYDEVYGRDGVTNDNYNDRLLESIHPDRMNVLTIHAEVEGRSARECSRSSCGRPPRAELSSAHRGIFFRRIFPLFPTDGSDRGRFPDGKACLRFRIKRVYYRRSSVEKERWTAWIRFLWEKCFRAAGLLRRSRGRSAICGNIR